ncbi:MULTISPECIES: hypothetical protein [unclassified Nonomuraea]|uniref:hypothetical protein n=1 Tax=unclassified Nonomuraea TaxID=2593643 RepID=UPI00340CB561
MSEARPAVDPGSGTPSGRNIRLARSGLAWLIVFEGVNDIGVARAPAAPRNLLPAYDVGDHLHLNPAGYKALAEAVPAGPLRRPG